MFDKLMVHMKLTITTYSPPMNAHDIISAIVAHSDTKTRLSLAMVAPKWHHVVVHATYGATHYCFHNLTVSHVPFEIIESACRHYSELGGTRSMKAALVNNIDWLVRFAGEYKRCKELFAMIYNDEDITSTNDVVYLLSTMMEGVDKQNHATLRNRIMSAYHDESGHTMCHDMVVDVLKAQRAKSS